MKKISIICMKWGTVYGPEYVNILHAMVKRHLSLDHDFICFTDDRTGINKNIECRDLPNISLGSAPSFAGWRKISTLSPELGIEGTILFLDLDLVITGSIDCLFDYKPGSFCIIENWSQMNQMTGNSSVYRYEAGTHNDIFEHFNNNCEDVYANYKSSQLYMTRKVAENHKVEFWPDEWVRSFKRHSIPNRFMRYFVKPKLPKNCKVLVFHGPPKPSEAAVGFWENKGKQRKILPSPWILDHWRE